MLITANNPNRKSWIPVKPNSDFPIQNIPFGVFITKDDIVTVGSRIGDYSIDLGALHQLGYFQGIDLTDDMFLQDSLNDFISDGRKTWRKVRNRIAEIFDVENPELQQNENHRNIVLFEMKDVEMQLPVHIGDYTDFYSSKVHATNVEKLLNGDEKTDFSNWLHMPIAYHGRSSSIVVSGTPIRRPKGQTIIENDSTPIFGPSQMLDFELEIAFITTDANKMGESISVKEAEDHIFGLVLLNDWTARDIQKWEFEPLGPFLSKNFASTISPWIITLDALEPFRVESQQQFPKPLHYLQQEGKKTIDIQLQIAIKPDKGSEKVISNSNFKTQYWTMAQQIAHHTINGCNLRSGDLFGSGTVSGNTPDSYGSMIELTWAGTKPIILNDGSNRKFINDFDTIIMKGFCKNEQVRIGFGECKGKIFPPKKELNK
jgi:fumarylacetoacetase